MKKKSAKEKQAELKRYNTLCRRIFLLEERKRELWLGSIMSVPCTDKTPAGAPDGTRTERLVEKLSRLDDDIAKLSAERTACKKKIEAAILKLSDGTERKVMRLMYLTGTPVALSVVAAEIGYSFRHTQRLYAAALRHINV